MKRMLYRIVKVAAGLVLVVVVLFGALHTGPGKAVIASALSRSLSRSADVDVQIGRISGWIPGNVRIDRVEIGDAQGEWLAARNLHCRWIVRELFAGRVRLRELGADEIELHRFPSSSPETASGKKAQWGVPSVAIQLDGMQIDHFRLGKGVAGMPLEYRVRSGGIALEKGRLSGGVAINGDAEGWVDFETSLTDPSGYQLKLSAELKQMNKPTFGLDRLSGSGEATIGADGVTAVIVARMEEKGQTGNLSTRLHYADGQLQLQQFQLKGPKNAAGGDATFGFSKDLVDVALTAELVDGNTNHFSISGTASIATENKTWSVNVQSMEVRGWDAVACSVSGVFNPQTVDMTGELLPFDIDQLPMAGLSAFNGKVSGRFSISGPLAGPRAEAGIEVQQFSSKKNALDELPELDFLIVGTIADGRLFASTSLTNFSHGFLVTELEMPAELSLSPLRFHVKPKAFGGTLDADLNLNVFNGLAFMERQRMEGLLTASLMRENQAMSGFVKLEKGIYEHYEWGMVFSECTADFEATSHGFLIKKAHAIGGKSGRLDLTGQLQNGLLDVQLDLAGAHVVQRPEIEAAVSGKLKLAGAISRPSVTGRLVIDRADILPDNMMLSKPKLLTNYDARSIVEHTGGNKPRKAFPVAMDVRIEMPDQVYVNASLIDSVWGGALHLKDVPSGLSITGHVAPRRGFVTFIGKKFRFQRGDIQFNGIVPTMPVFNDLTAEYARSDFSARLILYGEVNDPQFRLESTPALPEDEILSHVLFNRDTSTISPYQAIQIAAAARQLSGGLSGPGFMFGFRQAIGIDTLEWREPDAAGGSSSVAAGKYITSELYVEVDSTFDGPDSTGMTAEYELNPHFSVETSAGPRMRPGIGINWKNDY